MRWVSYQLGEQPSYGLVVGGGRVVDAGPRGNDTPPTLRAAIEHGLAALATRLKSRQPSLRLDDLRLAPPVPDPGKILCVGLNYRTHREESHLRPADHPDIFIRFADTQVGHRGVALIPTVSSQLDYEGELAVIIGRRCFQISPEEALDAVAGYSCYNDFSVRDWQWHASQWTAGKNFPGTGAFGPWMVSREELQDVNSLVLTTEVNGDVRQSAEVREMIWPVEELIAYISSFTVLQPGDVLVTGTPAGVGGFRDPPSYLREGDLTKVSISGIGELWNSVARAAGSENSHAVGSERAR